MLEAGRRIWHVTVFESKSVIRVCEVVSDLNSYGFEMMTDLNVTGFEMVTDLNVKGLNLFLLAKFSSNGFIIVR